MGYGWCVVDFVCLYVISLVILFDFIITLCYVVRLVGGLCCGVFRLMLFVSYFGWFYFALLWVWVLWLLLEVCLIAAHLFRWRRGCLLVGCGF